MDGKRGHENQTLSLEKSLRRKRNLICHEIPVSSTGRGLFNWITGRFPEGRTLTQPDLILGADDGMKSYAGWLWAADQAVPIIIVNHATSEKPGMMAMAQYLRAACEGIPTVYVDVGPPFRSVQAAEAE